MLRLNNKQYENHNIEKYGLREVILLISTAETIRRREDVNGIVRRFSRKQTAPASDIIIVALNRRKIPADKTTRVELRRGRYRPIDFGRGVRNV